MSGKTVRIEQWIDPQLIGVTATDHAVVARARTRSGQTLNELEAGVERIATSMGATAYRTSPTSGATIDAEFVLRDLLVHPLNSTGPEPGLVVETVRLGRTQAGRTWRLQLVGRHTLTVGASGSGKGSIVWGICCGLAPAVKVDAARLWGVDLKRGVELAMGAGLFSAVAYTPERAVEVLEELVQVLEERGDRMAGTTRQHSPTPGDPVHVLVIDELAALTAYAPTLIRREAERLLSIVLTQGRALGVVVVAFVQGPRKEVVAMRGLFTQTCALRLRTS